MEQTKTASKNGQEQKKDQTPDQIIDQKIEDLQKQYNEAIEVQLRCEGAITVLTKLKKELKDATK